MSLHYNCCKHHFTQSYVTIIIVEGISDAVALWHLLKKVNCFLFRLYEQGLTTLANEFISQGVQFIAINSNDITQYPEDSPEKMREIGLSLQYPFAYVFDNTQEVAQAYHAACTPDFFVFDKDLLLVYRGQLDDSRPGNNLDVTGDSIRNALNCILNNQPITILQKPSLGCNIKWKT